MLKDIMTEEATQVQDQKPDNKEYNFRQLEAKYERKLAEERAAREQERTAREQAERLAQEALAKKQTDDDEEDYSEPYVDHKRFKKEQAKFGQKLKQETKSEISNAVKEALAEERRQNWLKSNSDFFEVMQHAEKFAQVDPELAETILEMPNTFERQKLVYKNIKALGIHKPAEKTPSIQDKVDANRRSPYYQPSGFANAPYANGGDFSQSGQKNAYQKMQELKSKLRI
jgi:hypothetical protein